MVSTWPNLYTTLHSLGVQQSDGGDFGISYTNIYEGMSQGEMTSFPWKSPEEIYYSRFGKDERGFKMLSWTLGLLLLECLSSKNITDIKTRSDTFEMTGVPSIEEEYVKDLASKQADSPRTACVEFERLDNLVEECLQWDPVKRISMYGICKRLELEVDSPLSSTQKLDKNIQEVSFSWDYDLFLLRMRLFFERIDKPREVPRSSRIESLLEVRR